MKRKFDVETWARREHFKFFSQFEEQLYGVTVMVDCTLAYQTAKAAGYPFFLYYLHKSLTAALATGPFTLRIEGGGVFVYDDLAAAITVARPDGTFGYGDVDYNPSFEVFAETGRRVIAEVSQQTDLQGTFRQDVILYSALPWINFTSISHIRYSGEPDGRPRISFGKVTDDNGRKLMPMSVHVNHALVDGVHIGQYVDRFQELMNQ